MPCYCQKLIYLNTDILWLLYTDFLFSSLISMVNLDERRSFSLIVAHNWAGVTNAESTNCGITNWLYTIRANMKVPIQTATFRKVFSNCKVCT